MPLGPNIENELTLALAGLTPPTSPSALGLAWAYDSGTLNMGSADEAQIAAIEAVLTAHDPSKPDPNKAAAALLAGGLTITSAGTPALDGIYGTSVPNDEANVIGMQAAVTAGVFPGFYRDKVGVKHTMTGAQFTTIATAILDFIVAIEEAKETALGGTAWVAPSNAATVA